MILNDRRKKRMRPLHSDLFSFEIELSSQTEKKIVHAHTYIHTSTHFISFYQLYRIDCVQMAGHSNATS